MLSLDDYQIVKKIQEERGVIWIKSLLMGIGLVLFLMYITKYFK